MLLSVLSLINTPEDRSKLSEIYDRYFLQMYNYAVSLLKTRSEAEDAVQETFLALAKNIDKIKDPASRAAAGYVMVTLKNKIADIKRNKKRDEKLLDKIEPEYREIDDDAVDLLIRNEQIERVKKAVQALKSNERRIMLMRLYDELSFEDIAKLTGMSEGNVKNVYYRSLAKLREMLEDKENE